MSVSAKDDIVNDYKLYEYICIWRNFHNKKSLGLKKSQAIHYKSEMTINTTPTPRWSIKHQSRTVFAANSHVFFGATVIHQNNKAKTPIPMINVGIIKSQLHGFAR